MSLAEEMLANMSVSDDSASYLTGQEGHIVINESRIAVVPAELKTIAVTGDKDIETVTFDCVRYWDGNDLSTFAIYLNYILPNGDEGTYIPKGISKAEDTFSFDWLIGSEFTYAQGKMTFWIVAKLTDDSGTLIKQWSSLQNSDCTIAQGGDKIYVPEKQTDQDVISQAISISRASAETAEQQANLAIEAANKAALDAREAAEDEVTRLVGELGVVQAPGKSPTSVVSQAVTTALYNRNAKRITNLEQGVAEQFETDASVAYVKDVPANALPYAEIAKIGGMTYKDGDTLRSAKVTEVKSVGVNLLDSLKISKTNINGIAIEYLKDEDCFLINGTATHTGMRSRTAVNIPLKKHTLYRITNSYVSGTITRPSGTGYAMTYVGYNNPDTTNPNWFSCDLNMSDSEIAGNSYKATTLTHFWFYIDAGVSFNNYKVRVMIYESDTLLPYRPYTKRTLPIPEAVQALPDYGEGLNNSYQNVLKLDTSRYIRWVRRLLAGEKRLVNAQYSYENIVYYALNKGGTADYAKAAENILVSDFPIYTGPAPWDSSERIGTVTGNADYGWYWFGFPKGTTLEEAQAIIDNSDILVTLATAEITDISDLITADDLIGVEGGGTLTFENEYGYAVPSEVEYQVEV